MHNPNPSWKIEKLWEHCAEKEQPRSSFCVQGPLRLYYRYDCRGRCCLLTLAGLTRVTSAWSACRLRPSRAGPEGFSPTMGSLAKKRAAGVYCEQKRNSPHPCLLHGPQPMFSQNPKRQDSRDVNHLSCVKKLACKALRTPTHFSVPRRCSLLSAETLRRR